MMAGTGQSEIDQVREATDLVRLVSEHVAIQPRGREYVGLCPFHDDHKPSFAVVTHKGSSFFHCFACGASGDCFRFVMRFHSMEFGEALRYLAERAGITLQPRGAAGGERDDGGPRRGDLIATQERALAFFRRVLADSAAGATARGALEDRGITPDMVDRFQLGAAPEGYDGLLRRLDASDRPVARAAGLLKTRQDESGEYDAFRNRLMFPICDEVGRPVAFGGRILDPDDQPKYLNSAESPIFRKSRTLYGLHLARRSIMDASLAIVTEGYTDVIACHQAGFENVVGTLGTALTADHARILARICDTVVLLFDGDEAGQKAADRGVEVFF
ncbi:MAG: DNA primase, partial [Phycisphaerae bacterium]|nr:DNA primase [Phycisphaerae bacterium]